VKPSEPSNTLTGRNNKRPHKLNPPLKTTSHQAVTNIAMLNVKD